MTTWLCHLSPDSSHSFVIWILTFDIHLTFGLCDLDSLAKEPHVFARHDSAEAISVRLVRMEIAALRSR